MVTCTECGERNPAGTEFCLYCHAFLAWDETAAPPPKPQPRVRDDQPPPEGAVETRPLPRVVEDALFRLAVADEVRDQGVTVAPDGQPTTLPVRLTNTSGIVDGYAVAIPGGPPWLRVDADQISLLPGAEDSWNVRLQVVSETMVPAQQLETVLRVTSLSQAPASQDLTITLTVAALEAPVRLRAEPRLLRTRDSAVAEATVTVDNTASNRPAELVLSGSDPELAVEFRFEPPILQVPPGGHGSAKLSVRAPLPEPGRDASRALTIVATQDSRTVENSITWQQSASVVVEDPMVGLEVVPSVLRVRDRTEAVARLVVDNTAGKAWAHVRLEAGDPERLVRVSWEQPMLHVPPGRTTQTEIRFEARLPEAGTEASRVITVAASDGRRRASTTATFVQAASTSAMATLALRLEPSVLKVSDADSAHGKLVVDNRRGASGLRLYLSGSDPEGSMRFAFEQPVLDVGPGQSLTTGIRLDAWRPPPGEQASRAFTISAGDGQSSVEASGTLSQTSSRNPIELLQLKLDPTVLQLAGGRRGQITAVLDNRAGTQPVRVRLRGDDPMNLVGFAFHPPELEVPPGAVTTSVVTLESPRAPAGQELTRPISVVASDGRSETPPAEGSVVQSSPARVSYARQIWRVLLTLLGGLAMIAGTLQPFSVGGAEEAASEFDASEISQTFGGPDLLAFDPPFLPTAGLLIIVLAVIMMFGLTGPSGRLTRMTALFTALAVVGFSIALIIFGASSMLGLGAFVIVLGCVLGYVGGLLVKR